MPIDDLVPDDQAAALRAELEQVRLVSAERIRELEIKLERSRNVLPMHRDPGAVAENLAVQQTIDALRAALGEKERVIEEQTKQTRSLEDRLEDHYQELDGLQRRLDQSERDRATAEERARLAGRRSAAPMSTPANPASSTPAPPPGSAPARPPQPRRRPAAAPPPTRKPAPDRTGSSGRRPGMFGGLAAGLLIGAVVAGGLWWMGRWPPPRPRGAPLWPLTAAVEPPADTRPQAAGAPSGRTSRVSPTAGPQPATEPPAPEPVRGIVQDAGGPSMVALGPGRFVMGGGATDPTSDARPAHEVRLDAFLIGTNEVTFDEYDRYVRATGARQPDDFGHGRGRQPVVGVSWNDAVAYADWLSRRTGRHYRLPTEAEWEYAARAGTTTAYWWGAAPEQGVAVCFDCGTRWDRLSPAPVGSFPPNPFGLNDTAGGVAEWVADCYRPGYRDAPADGSAVDVPGCTERVARGGSWSTPLRSLRSERRASFPPDTRNAMIGFRVARRG